MKHYKIAVLAGDGIGPEITQEAIKVLKVIEERNAVSFELMPSPLISSQNEEHCCPCVDVITPMLISARFSCLRRWGIFHR